jgi:hypothetical protein
MFESKECSKLREDLRAILQTEDGERVCQLKQNFDKARSSTIFRPQLRQRKSSLDAKYGDPMTGPPGTDAATDVEVAAAVFTLLGPDATGQSTYRQNEAAQKALSDELARSNTLLQQDINRRAEQQRKLEQEAAELRKQQAAQEARHREALEEQRVQKEKAKNDAIEAEKRVTIIA